MRRVRNFWSAVALIVMLCFATVAHGAALNAGTAWLEAAQDTSGSWGNTPSALTDEYIATALSVEALVSAGLLNSASVADAAVWLASQSLESTAHVTMRYLSLSGLGLGASVYNATADLDMIHAALNADGGWGGYLHYGSSPLQTALAMQATHTRGHANENTMLALTYLLTAQNADGGWGFYAGDESSLFVTVHVVRLLKGVTQYTQIIASIGNGKAYLLSRQNADGGFGRPASGVIETALAVLALDGQVTDATVIGNAREYLSVQADAEGSWAGDPYTTALVLQALQLQSLSYTEGVPPGALPPTTGSIAGHVIDAVTGEGIAGVSVDLACAPELSLITGAEGSFHIDTIPPGVCPIALSKAGYVALALEAGVAVGTVSDFGNIPLAVIPTHGVILGKITDLGDGSALPGVQISVTGAHTATTQTEADGAYSIASVTPGAVTISLTHAGYYDVSASGNVVAGGTLSFSPSMQQTPPADQPGSLSGTVQDAVSAAPLSGVSVSLISNTSINTVSSGSGHFLIAEMPDGPQTAVLSLAGYAPVYLNVDTSGGFHLNVGVVSMLAEPDPQDPAPPPAFGIIRGVVSDFQNGDPIEGSKVVIDGDASLVAITDVFGSYVIEGVPAGSVSITVSKDKHDDATATLQVPEGGILNHSVSLRPKSGIVEGVVVEYESLTPLTAATVALSNGLTASVDATGAFRLEKITPGSYTITFSADGYEPWTRSVSVPTCSLTRLGNVELIPIVDSTTVTGQILDARTQQPLEGATVQVVGTDLSATSGPDGVYSLAGVYDMKFTLRASLAGYDSVLIQMTTSGYGVFSADFQLTGSSLYGLSISGVASDREYYSANDTVTLTATLLNEKADIINGVVTFTVYGPDGTRVGTASNTGEALVSFAPGELVEVEAVWQTRLNPAGRYTYNVDISSRPMTLDNYSPGNLMAGRSGSFTIEPTPGAFGSLRLDPPSTLADLSPTVNILGIIRNDGNVPLDASLTLDVTRDGAVVYSTDLSVTGLPLSALEHLDLGSFVPDGPGLYRVSLRSAEPQIDFEVTVDFYSGDHVQASLTLETDTVLPGTSTIKGTVDLSRVASFVASSTDELEPIIWQAVERAVDYSLSESIRWHRKNNYDTRRCNGCHIQAQAAAGLQSVMGKVPYDQSAGVYMTQAFLDLQSDDGYFIASPAYQSVTTTLLGIWALSYFNDQQSVRDNIIRAADFLLEEMSVYNFYYLEGLKRYGYGPYVGWWTGSGGWWGGGHSGTAIGMIGMIHAYELTGDTKYLDAVDLNVSFFLNRTPAFYDIAGTGNMVYALLKARDYYAGTERYDQIQARIDSTVASLVAGQEPNGAWKYYFNDEDDMESTLIALYALSEAGLGEDDFLLREALEYILNAQDPDGSWTDSRHQTPLTTTTWAVLALPRIMEHVYGINAEVTMDMAVGVDLAKSSPIPTSSTGDTHVWKVFGVDRYNKKVDVEITLDSMMLGETRAVADSAFISLVDPASGQAVRIPVDIPSVTASAAVVPSVETDKPTYTHDETVDISIRLKNITHNVATPILEAAVIDSSGNVVEVLDARSGVSVEPIALKGWHYRYPLVISADWDMEDVRAETTANFRALLDSLSLQGRQLDANSIRLVESDGAGGVIGEQALRVEFVAQETATLTWVVDGQTSSGTARHYYVYFDIEGNGPKPPSEMTKLPVVKNYLAYNTTYGSINLIPRDKDGTFGEAIFIDDITDGSDGSNTLAYEDFDNDGFADIITTSGYTDKIYLYRTIPGAIPAFHPKEVIADLDHISNMSIQSADFNGDGLMDFVLSKYMGRTYPWYSLEYESRTLNVYCQNQTGAFDLTKVRPGEYGSVGMGTLPRSLSVVDYDEDGNLDLITNLAEGVVLFRGNGDCTFHPLETLFPSRYVHAVGDLFHKGGVGLLMGNYVYRKSADGSLVYYSTLWNIKLDLYQNIYLADVTGDGILDLLGSARDVGAARYKRLGLHRGIYEDNFDDQEILASTVSDALVHAAMPRAYAIVHPLSGPAEEVGADAIKLQWNTGQTFAGDYSVRVTATDAHGNVASASAPFAIKPDRSLFARVSTDRISYTSTDTVEFRANVISRSANLIMEALEAELTVTGPDGAASVVEQAVVPVATLLPGQSVGFKHYWAVGSAAKGLYVATLRVRDASGTLSTFNKEFKVQGTSNTGAGLTGTASVLPDPVRSGDEIAVAYTVTNGGNEDLIGLPVSTTLVDAISGTAVQTVDVTLDLPVGTTHAGSAVFSTASLDAGVHFVVVRATVGNPVHLRTLASATFTVEKPTIEATKAMGAPTLNVLLWLNYPWATCEQSAAHLCPDAGAIINSLSASGAQVTAVYDKKAFGAELRNPYYTDYVILGDHHPIEGSGDYELRERVYAGRGLVSSLFNHTILDGPVFGVKVHGSLSTADNAVEMPAPAFTSVGRTNRIDVLDPAKAAGQVLYTQGKKAASTPAMATHAYGLGRSAYIAFDLGLTASADPSAMALLTDTLADVRGAVEHPSPLVPFALVPVELSVVGQADAMTVSVTEAAPDGFALYDPLTGIWPPLPWVYTLGVPAETGAARSYLVLTPDATGDFDLVSTVTAEDGATVDALLTLDVRSIADRTYDAIGLISALALDATDAEQAAAAIAALEASAGRAMASPADAEASIAEVVAAMRAMDAIAGADVTGVRDALGAILAAWEGYWYFY